LFFGKEKLTIMGEVRIKITLTNTFDEMLARRGQLPVEKIRSYQAQALVDTGAVRSVLPINVAERLGIQMRGRRLAEYADGRKETMDVTEPVIFEYAGRDTLEEALVLGDEVLIGQTLLEKMDLLVDGASHQVIPNPAHPDQPVTKVK
jgi:clan AA aspartic protease